MAVLIVTIATLPDYQSKSGDSKAYRSSVMQIMVKYSENAEFLSVLLVASINHPKEIWIRQRSRRSPLIQAHVELQELAVLLPTRIRTECDFVLTGT